MSGYLAFLFAPFFRWWWTLITGVASILSFATTPPEGASVSRWTICLLTLFICALLFLTLSAVAQSWKLYISRSIPLEVVSVQKSADYGGECAILLRGQLPMVVDVRRPMGDREAPFALVEILDRTARGNYQGKPIAQIAPVHLKDLAAGKFAASELVAYPYVDADRIRAAVEHLRAAGG